MIATTPGAPPPAATPTDTAPAPTAAAPDPTAPPAAAPLAAQAGAFLGGLAVVPGQIVSLGQDHDILAAEGLVGTSLGLSLVLCELRRRKLV